MLKYLPLFMFVQISICNKISAQDFTIHNNPLFNLLIQSNQSIPVITNGRDDNYIPLFDTKNRKNFKLVKNKDGLFLLVNGTGKLYKVSNELNNAIKFTRIDSTFFTGYNQSSIDFSYHDTVFSLGGSGFWKINGQLRYFSKASAEWNILKITNEYPAFNLLYNYLENKSTIYWISPSFEDPATFNKIENNSVIKLNLKTKKTERLGILSSKYNAILNELKISTLFSANIPSLNGTLVYYKGEEEYLFNFEKNEVYKLTNHLIQDKIFQKSNGEFPSTCFEYNNKLYYTIAGDSSFALHLAEFSMKDFTKEPYPLYESDNKISIDFISVYAIAITLIMLSFIIWLVKNKKNKIEIVDRDKNEEDLLTINFSELEKTLIEKIIEKTNQSALFTVDEFNLVLGLSKKSIEIQKKIRGEAIIRINHKFKVRFNQKEDLIERIRSEEDRRFFQYKISNENATLYKLSASN